MAEPVVLDDANLEIGWYELNVTMVVSVYADSAESAHQEITEALRDFTDDHESYVLDNIQVSGDLFIDADGDLPEFADEQGEA